MSLTDEVIAQVFSYDKNISLFSGVSGLIFAIIVIIILGCFALPVIIGYFKERKFFEAFLNIIIALIMGGFFTAILYYVGVSNIEQYKYYDKLIKNKSFDVLKVEIEDKKLDGYKLILKNFGTIQVSKSNYHTYEKGESVYIVYVPVENGKYMFTDLMYSAEEYYRE